MRICLVYDLLYPRTVGGAERWYRNAALRLAQEGHGVTYLTMRHWSTGAESDLPGVRVIAVARRMPLYTDGRRLRGSTLAWFASNADRLSLEASLETVRLHYQAA